jgi:demethylmenaquinone methyltransferase/2-methoxy-6-polyprenyl-1,4-benzoquinol methylase
MTTMPASTPPAADRPPADASDRERWSPDDLQRSPHDHEQKAEKVRAMFAAISRRYDLNNRLHSFGRDQAWRRAAVRAASIEVGDRVLDVACGTGDLTLLLAKATPATEVVGGDFTPQMLDVARRRNRHDKIRYVHADAMDLPFEDRSFDALTIAFGIRNVADPAAALREFRRVLKPGGRLVILEFATPKSKIVRTLNAWYTKTIMPVTAGLIARDRTGAYRYLPRSIETFLQPEAMRKALEDGGFRSVSARPMTLGVCVCYRALRDA